MANTSSTTGQLLIKVRLQVSKTDLKLSPVWGLLAGLYNTPMYLPFCTIHLICTLHAAHSTLKLFTGLWSYDYPAPRKLSTPALNCVLPTAGAAELQPEHHPTNRSTDPIRIQLVNTKWVVNYLDSSIRHSLYLVIYQVPRLDSC